MRLSTYQKRVATKRDADRHEYLAEVVDVAREAPPTRAQQATRTAVVGVIGGHRRDAEEVCLGIELEVVLLHVGAS